MIIDVNLEECNICHLIAIIKSLKDVTELGNLPKIRNYRYFAKRFGQFWSNVSHNFERFETRHFREISVSFGYFSQVRYFGIVFNHTSRRLTQALSLILLRRETCHINQFKSKHGKHDDLMTGLRVMNGITPH